MRSTELSFGLCLAAALAAAPAQEPPSLRELARAEATGGPVEQLVLRTDGKRLLTAGSRGDLILWELPGGRILRRFEPLHAEVVAMAIHGSRPLALCAVDYGRSTGAVFAVDLDDGRRRLVAGRLARDLAFSPAGDLCAIRLRLPTTQQIVTLRCEGLFDEGPLPEVARTPVEVAATGRLGFVDEGAGWRAGVQAAGPADLVRSPNDEHRGNLLRRGLQRFAPRLVEQDFTEHVATQLCTAKLADDGTFAAADWAGQIVVQGLETADPTVLTGHLGSANQLVWTPDSRFVAITAVGAVRIVGRDGRIAADLPGSRRVQAGPDGSEFWLLGPRSLRRWNAAHQRDVMPPRTWTGPRVGSRIPATGPESALAPAAVVAGEPWFVDELGRPVRGHAGQFTAIEGLARGDAVPSSFLPWRDGGVVWSAAYPPPAMLSDGSDLCVGRSTADGRLAVRKNLRGATTLFADVGDGATVLVLVPRADAETVGCRLERRDTTSLEPVATSPWLPRLRHVEPLDAQRLLASDHRGLHVLDAATLAPTGTVALSADFARIDAFAVAPDRLHVALSSGGQVRICRIE